MSELTDLLRERARAALPQVEGQVEVSGLHEAVEVLWDRWGVPHIYAGSTHDLYFAQGYVLASERLFQMDFTLRLGSGHLSELLGEVTLPLDRFIRTVGWNRAPDRLMAGWDDLSLEIAEAFAGGARAWVERMPARPIEYDILQADPGPPRGRGAHPLGRRGQRVHGVEPLVELGRRAAPGADRRRARLGDHGRAVPFDPQPSGDGAAGQARRESPADRAGAVAASSAVSVR